MPDNSFIETINHLFGGAITTLIGAFTGRLMWHSGEVKLGIVASSAKNSFGKSQWPWAWRSLAMQRQITSV